MQAVQYDPIPTPLPVDAYALGVVLGGGGLWSAPATGRLADVTLQVHVRGGHEETASIMAKLRTAYPDMKHVEEGGVACSSGCMVYLTCPSLVAALRTMGVMSLPGTCSGGSSGACQMHIHVPERYLRGRVSERLDLLRGVMDTCGAKGETTFAWQVSECRGSVNVLCTAAAGLVVYLTDIVLSLGGLAYDRTACHKDGLHRVEVFLPSHICPFYNHRKVAVYKACHEHKYKHLERHEDKRVAELSLGNRLIVDIYPSRRTAVMCISVAAQDRLYVCEQYALTHNTVQAVSCAAVYAADWPVLVVAPPSARHHWQAELKTWLCPELCAVEDILLIDSVQHGMTYHMSEPNFSPHKFVIISYAILPKVS